MMRPTNGTMDAKAAAKPFKFSVAEHVLLLNGYLLWVLHTSRRLPAPKVRAFVEFMCDQYPEVSLVLRG